jgi:chromosome segregation ATPase
MRCLTVFVFFATMLLSEAAIFSGSAQIQTGAQEKAASLRAQLNEVEAKQAELQTRLQTLEENLRPENIEKNLAGVGSTKPEDLREQRRRQLEIERNGVQAQLNLLATSRTRLEQAIAQADGEAYRQSAAPVITTSTDTSSTAAVSAGAATTPKRQRRVRKRKARLIRH